MKVVCPSVKNGTIAQEVIQHAFSLVRLRNSLVYGFSPDDQCEFDRGWDVAELHAPMLKEFFPDEFRKSELFLIFEFEINFEDGTIERTTIHVVDRSVLNV